MWSLLETPKLEISLHLLSSAQAVSIFINQSEVAWRGQDLHNKSWYVWGSPVLKKPVLGIQKSAFEYQQPQTNPLHKEHISKDLTSPNYISPPQHSTTIAGNEAFTTLGYDRHLQHKR